MNSFISWIGGKKALREIIVERFPVEYERYIEVFGGAGWVLFYKKPEEFEVYNDYNSNLTNLFHTIKYKPLEFIKELGWLPLNGREEFDVLKKWLKQYDFSLPYLKGEEETAKRYMNDLELGEYIELMNKQSSLGDVKRAVIFYKLIRYSYASSCDSYSCQPTDILSICKTIWNVNRRLNENGSINKKGKLDDCAGKGVIIENKDFQALICHYDRNNAFFYCDPPYYKTESYYDVAFEEKDHYRLRDTLKQIQGKFMVSYNDCEFIREIYSDYYIEAIERTNNISQRYNPGNMFKEVIITNYDLSEIQKHKPRQIMLDV